MKNPRKKQSHNSFHYHNLQRVIFLTAFAFWSMAACVGAAERQQTDVQRHVVRIPINDFTLVDQNGDRFEFKSAAGRVSVVSFVYTTCVDVCPLITAAMRQVQNRLPQEERKHVLLISITTDPEIDSPKVFRAYAKRYGAEFDNWVFLTGNLEALQKIWKNFGVRVKREARGLVDHTPLTAIVDQRQVMRLGYIGPSPDPEAVLTDVHVLLKER